MGRKRIVEPRPARNTRQITDAKDAVNPDILDYRVLAVNVWGLNTFRRLGYFYSALQTSLFIVFFLFGKLYQLHFDPFHEKGKTGSSLLARPQTYRAEKFF